MKSRSVHSGNTLYLTQLAVLVVILFLMELTGLGYIRTPGLEFTVMTVPVIVGAIVLGPGAGAILGTVFGLTSFWQCVSGKSPFGATLLSINPFGAFVTTVPTRLLVGLVCGLIFVLFRRVMKNRGAQYALASIAGALSNTVLFMGMLVLFYYRTDFIQGFVSALGSPNALAFVFAFVGVQGLLEAIICAFLGTVIAGALKKYIKS
jgi:uncharacterized membrane protein